MQEVFYEESVTMHNEKPAKRRYTIFTVTAVLCFILAFVSFINLMWTPTATADGESLVGQASFTISLVVWGLLCVSMIVGGVFLIIKRHAFYLSYDYTFVSGELRISKVLHGRKRKLLYRISDEKYIKIGRVGSESYKKLKSSPDVKEDILTPNEEAAEDKEFYYVQAATNVGKKLLVLECRQELLANILRYTRRNLLESEFNRK